MSGEEFDLTWKSNKRPQSTIAQNFSIDLHDLFKIGNSISDLHAAVYAKKRAVYSQTSELRKIEERLRVIEERLNRVGIKPVSPSECQTTRRNQSTQSDSFNNLVSITSDNLDHQGKFSHSDTDRLVCTQNRSRPYRKNEEAPNLITSNTLPPSPATSEDIESIKCW